MRRGLSLALHAVSLLLLIGTIALWVRSYWVEDLVTHANPTVGSRAAWSRDGRLSLWWDRYFEAKVLPPKTAGWDYQSRPMIKPGRWPDGTRGTLGFARDGDKTGKAPWSAVAIPYWGIVAVLLIPEVLGICAILRRRRRQRVGHCVGCGYDLRASHGRCPECGRPIAETLENQVGRSTIVSPVPHSGQRPVLARTS